MTTPSPVFVPKESQSLVIADTKLREDSEKTHWVLVSWVSKVEIAFNEKFDAIMSFVETAQLGEVGQEITEMLGKFRHEIHFLCTFNDGYAQYSRKLDFIRTQLLDKYSDINDDSLIYYKIIQRSLEYLAEELGFDYVGIWKDVSDNEHPNAMTPIHEIGSNSLIQEGALFEQMKIAKEACVGREFIYNYPSDSQLGIVDTIYVFKNSLGQAVGYLAIDNIEEQRALTDTEKIAITTYFYNELKNMIKEHELSLSINSIKQLQMRNAQLEEITEHDPMTWLFNRKALLKIFNVRLEDFNRLKVPMSVIMIDIDHFKKINDTYGHPVGDEVIKFLGSILSGMRSDIFAPRNNDYFFRMWGEEFLWLLSNVTSEQAEGVCERIRQALEKHIFTTSDGKQFSITASFGITQMMTTDVPKEYLKSETLETKIPDYTIQIITRADKALYCAKNDGRNCIKFFTEETSI